MKQTNEKTKEETMYELKLIDLNSAIDEMYRLSSNFGEFANPKDIRESKDKVNRLLSDFLSRYYTPNDQVQKEREEAVRGFAKWVDGDSKKLLSRYNYFIDMATQYLSKGKDKE